VDILGAIYSFVAGTCVGSFLNVCISRWPEGRSVVSPRSRCLHCDRPLRAVENIPLVSWALQRGRCKGCGKPISFQYPLVELIVGGLWLAAYLYYGLTFTAVRVAVLVTVLLGIAVTDAKRYLIPDGFTVFGLVWVLLTAMVSIFVGDADPFAEFHDALIGACAGAGAIAIAGWLGEVALKKEAMGFGDVTLMAVVGAAVGPYRALIAIFLGALMGAIVFLAIVYPIARVRARRTKSDFHLPLVPFGVFLAPAAMIALLWGDALVSTYTRSAGP